MDLNPYYVYRDLNPCPLGPIGDIYSPDQYLPREEVLNFPTSIWTFLEQDTLQIQ